MGPDEGSDGEAEAWLHELCRAPRRSLLPTLSDSSDDDWLHELCRGQPPRSDAPVVVLEVSVLPALHHGSGVPVSSGPRSSGVPVCRRPAERSESVRGELGSNAQSTWRNPVLGHYQSMHQLVSDLELSQLRLPPSVWSMPARNDIIWDALELFRGSGVPVIGRCLWRIAAWSASLKVCIFKVGIAYDPDHRWRNKDFGYAPEQIWTFMDVLHRGRVAECRALEIDLIARLRDVPGCYNDKPGGEGISANSATCSAECHCYAVFAPAGSGLGVHAEWRKRRQLLVSEGSGVQVLEASGGSGVQEKRRRQ